MTIHAAPRARRLASDLSVYLAIAGTTIVLRYGAVPHLTELPHWLHHVTHAAIAASVTYAAVLLSRRAVPLSRAATIALAIWAGVETFFTLVALVWQVALSREISPILHSLELVLVFGYLGLALLAIGLIRVGGPSRWAGALLAIALIIDVAGVPWASGAGLLLAAGALHPRVTNGRGD